MLRSDSRVLITGGAGLVGSHLADMLVKSWNPEIIILDNFTRGRRENLRWALAHGNVAVVEGDIRNAALLNEVIQGVDIVFHQASIPVEDCEQDPRTGFEVLAEGTFNVLQAAALTTVRKVITASSAFIYGIADQMPVDEAHTASTTRSLRGAFAAFIEDLVRNFKDMYGLDYVVLRYFGVYGPRMSLDAASCDVLVRWMGRIAAGRPCLLSGDAPDTTDYVYVEDVARANVLAANSAISGEIFNVATGVETAADDVIQLLSDAMKMRARIERLPEIKARLARRFVGDPSKAEKILGFRARVSLQQGLPALVDWWDRHHNYGTSELSASTGGNSH